MYGVHLTGNKNPMFGRKRPDTSEFNIRTKKGKKLTKEHVKKITKALMGNTYRRGKKYAKKV
jgi:hypothetical protein